MIATLHRNREKGQRCGGDDSRMPETHQKTDHTQSLPNYPGNIGKTPGGDVNWGIPKASDL